MLQKIGGGIFDLLATHARCSRGVAAALARAAKVPATIMLRSFMVLGCKNGLMERCLMWKNELRVVDR